MKYIELKTDPKLAQAIRAIGINRAGKESGVSLRMITYLLAGEKTASPEVYAKLKAYCAGYCTKNAIEKDDQ